MDHAYQGRHPPARLAAMATSNRISVEQQWYTDTGAIDHITSDLSNLLIRSEYQGPDKVSVGNGVGLHISHVGSSHVSTPSATFNLNNMLCAPNMSANPLSVNRFTTDNNCLFIFDCAGFLIKDKATGNTLFLRAE